MMISEALLKMVKKTTILFTLNATKKQWTNTDIINGKMKRKTKHGGKRNLAGRKPIEDKKVPVTIYVRESVIEALGLEVVKERCYEALS